MCISILDAKVLFNISAETKIDIQAPQLPVGWYSLSLDRRTSKKSIIIDKTSQTFFNDDDLFKQVNKEQQREKSKELLGKSVYRKAH